MSLYNDASLAMIPSAVKDGKLYSIRPTDGSGDFTFSRGSNLAATRVDVNGLIEKGRENLLLQSNQFDTTWATTDSSVTSGQVGYDGNDAWLLNITSGSVNQNIRQVISQSGVQTFSVYLKAGSLSWAALGVDGSAVYCNLSNGTIGTTIGDIDSQVESVGNGWYRFSLTFSNSITYVRIYLASSDGSTTQSSGNIYIQDAQLEVGLVATDYIETTTTTAVSGITEDLPRLDYSGGASCPSLLLEPTRTNQVLNSEYRQGSDANDIRISSTSNASISPEGVQNATLFTENTDNNTHLHSLGNVSWVAGTTYTISVYAKSNGRNVQLAAGNPSVIQFTTAYDLINGVVLFSSASSSSIEDAGNGWYRLTATATAATSAGTNINTFLYNDAISYLGDNTSGVYVYGYQKEEASYPTSYIPCYGAATTRSVDVPSLISLQSNNIFGSTSGTALVEYTPFKFGYVFDYHINSLKYIRLYYDSTNELLRVRDTIASQWYETNLDLPKNQNSKVLLRWNGTTLTAFVNGIKAASDYTLTETIAVDYLEDLKTNKVKQISFFPTALTDSEAIALTTI